MPELPEVETIRAGLEPWLHDARLTAVKVREPRLRIPVDDAAMQGLVGRRAHAVDRRAKYLLVSFERDATLLIHLGMSGRVLIIDAGGDVPLDRHDHVLMRWATSRGPLEVRFRDPRRFGLMVVATSSELERHPLIEHLGPEPFDDSFSAEELRRVAQRSRRPVKNMLMDARVVTGIGNIYASEALWRARVNPKTRAGRIATVRWQRIRDACVEVLHEALRRGGTTLNDYRDPEGRRGSFEVRLSVYGREGEACRRCEGTVRRLVQSGRSTYYCPGCQA